MSGGGFTCIACGGFKYRQTPVQGRKEDVFCQDCYENGAMEIHYQRTAPSNFGIKPGLHEVLTSIHEAEFPGCDFKEWLDYNGGSEELAAAAMQAYMTRVWREHYQRITGEPWL